MFFNLAFLFNFIIDYILVLYSSVAFFISFIFSCFGLRVYCFVVLFFEKKEGADYKPYKRDQRIKVANHTNIDQN
ncbi:hypothetical protein KVC75_06700 [Helicobacter pylori]|nr:hypothetical protein KVC75_06700 [Helicobacter pylori]